MSYQALARKWRPRNFQEMVGQEPILRMLVNALNSNRLHHAYLFTGTRGVGKTTLARLFAKCINCQTGVTAHPCENCENCRAINEGKFLDLIEVDAASRTKVEDTRELLDNVHYPPVQGRYKVYLIDEVHMLSSHSFNALLKTLEEPPPDIKFLLATTDPKKLPITILSRCLQFHLKRVPSDKIANHLADICQSEKIQFDRPALVLLSEAADGSLRDGLSLLDQAIAFCNDHIAVDDIQQMLGCIEQNAILRLLDAVAKQDGKLLLDEISALDAFAPDFQQVLNDLLSILHQINLAQIVAKDIPSPIKNLATSLSPEDVQLYYQIALIGRRDLPLAPTPRLGFEMVMLRMLAFYPVKENQPLPPNNPPLEKRNLATSSLIDTQSVTKKTAALPNLQASLSWSELLSQLKLSGLAQALATNCVLESISDNKVKLILSINHQPMLNQKNIQRIEEALSEYFNKPMKVHIETTSTEIMAPAKQQALANADRHAKAMDAIQSDTHVKEILTTFEASIDLDSIKVID